MPRYFFGENAGRPVVTPGGKRYAFDIIATSGGTQQGVLQVPDDEVDAFLAIAGRWVTEIPLAEYEAELQKKKTPIRSPDSPAPARLGPPLKGRGAVVVDGNSIVQPKTKELPDSIDGAVTLGRADAPATEVAPPVRTTKRLNHREKRGFE